MSTDRSTEFVSLCAAQKRTGAAKARQGGARDAFMVEALDVLQHLRNMQVFFQSIRKPYEQAASRGIDGDEEDEESDDNDDDDDDDDDQEEPSSEGEDAAIGGRHGEADEDSTATNDSFLKLARPGRRRNGQQMTKLTSAQCDEVDVQSRMLIKQCMARVEMLEKAETARRKREQSTGFLLKLLRTDEEAARDQILAAHRLSITSYLAARLGEMSQAQKQLQEERLKIQLSAMRRRGVVPAAMPDVNPMYPSVEEEPNGTNTDEETQRQMRLQLRARQARERDEEANTKELMAIEAQLSPMQMQVLQDQSTALMDEFRDSLAKIKNVERSITEISDLQSELMRHLVAQNEVSDRLYHEATVTTMSVQRGNRELNRARRRHAASTKYIVFGLLSASLMLLLLDWIA